MADSQDAEDKAKDLREELFGSDDEEEEDLQQEDQQQAADEAAPDQEEEEGELQAPDEYDPEQQGANAAAGAEIYDPEEDLRGDWGGGRDDEAQEVGEGEDDELDAMFRPKKKRRQERDLQEKKLAVESILARMEVAAELDIEANTEHRPAIHKLQLLPDVEKMLVQRDLHDEFLDGGVLGVMKAWLEPMPDGSLPNTKVRAAVLRLLLQLNFFFDDRKEQLKKSGLGHVIMFLSKLPDETGPNRRMARDLVEKWSRPIFEQYRHDEGRQDDLEAEREADELRAQQRRQSQSSQPDDAPKLRPTDKGFRYHASIPMKAKLDYKKQPQSQVAVDASGGRKSSGGRSDKMVKKLAEIGKRTKQTGSGKAVRVSVEGRGMIVGS